MEQSELDYLLSHGIEVIKMIGVGLTSTIYYVYSSNYKSYFALKRIPSKFYSEKEYKIINLVDPHYRIQIVDSLNNQNIYYFLLEYCPIDISRVTSHQQRLPNEKLMLYIRNLVMTIKACHDRNICNGNIKPNNFLVDEYGNVKICDFALSHFADDSSEVSENKSSLYFMAPEVIRNRSYNPFAADIWSLGVTLYYLITRKYPFVGENNIALQYSIVHGIYNQKLIHDILLRDVINKCLDVNPQRRGTINDILVMPYFNQKIFQATNSKLDRRDLMFDLSLIEPYDKPHRLSLTTSIFSVQASFHKQSLLNTNLIRYLSESNSTEELSSI